MRNRAGRPWRERRAGACTRAARHLEEAAASSPEAALVAPSCADEDAARLEAGRRGWRTVFVAVAALALVVAAALAGQRGSADDPRQRHTSLVVRGPPNAAYNVTLRGLPYRTLQSEKAARSFEEGVEEAFGDRLDGGSVSATTFPGDTEHDTVVQVTFMADGSGIHTGVAWDESTMQMAVTQQVSKTASMLMQMHDEKVVKEQVLAAIEAGEVAKRGANITLGNGAPWQEVTVVKASDDYIRVAPVEGGGGGAHSIVIRLSRSTTTTMASNTSTTLTAVTTHTSEATSTKTTASTESLAVTSSTTTVQKHKTSAAAASTKKTASTEPSEVTSSTTTAQKRSTSAATTSAEKAASTEPSAVTASTAVKVPSAPTEASAMTASTAVTASSAPANDASMVTRAVFLQQLPPDPLAANAVLAGKVETAVQSSYASVLGLQSYQVFASIENFQRLARRLEAEDELVRELSIARAGASKELSMVRAAASNWTGSMARELEVVLQPQGVSDHTVVKVTIAPVGGQSLSELDAQADANEAELSETVAFSVEAIEGIEAVKTGQISAFVYRPGQLSDSLGDVVPYGGPVFGVGLLVSSVAFVWCCCRSSEAREPGQLATREDETLASACGGASELAEEADMERDELSREVFRMHDVDADGVLSEKELFFFARRLGYPDGESDFHAEFQRVCQAHGGITGRGLDPESFLKLISVPPPDDDGWYCSMEQLEELCEQPTSGRQDSAALKQGTLRSAPLPSTRGGLIQAVFEMFDANGDGILQRGELMKFAASVVETPYQGTEQEWDEMYDDFVREPNGVNLEYFTRLLNDMGEENPFYQSTQELQQLLSRRK